MMLTRIVSGSLVLAGQMFAQKITEILHWKLPGKQMQLVNRIASVTERPLVLVLIGGGPLDVSVRV
jgi:hypothetical protein